MTITIDDFNLPKNPTKSDLKKAWKSIRSKHHPDRGGDKELFIEYSKVYESLVQEFDVKVLCESCDGSGKITITKGFYSSNRRCPKCRGKGKIERPNI